MIHCREPGKACPVDITGNVCKENYNATATSKILVIEPATDLLETLLVQLGYTVLRFSNQLFVTVDLKIPDSCICA